MNKQIIIRISYLIISLFVYLFISQRVFATGEFQADYDVQYAVSTGGTTIVTQNITLTNKLTNLYPKQYSIILDTSRIKNIIAYDGKGAITPAITQTDGKTEILLNFNEKIVGLGKKIIFTIRFENDDIAKKLGSIWEVNIPGVARDPDLSSYAVSLHVPPSFGPNAYMSPLPAQGGRWNKDQMTQGGISAAYGEEQRFRVALNYFLQNDTITAKQYEIALPPDTAFQKVTIISIDPQPKTVRRDEDGNWLAVYDVSPSKKISVTAQLFIQISLSARPGYDEMIQNVGLYTRPLKYWESVDPKILELAEKYTTPRQIYDYVRTTLVYNYDRVNQSPIRKGALQALSTPQSAICMEFSDLFVAIARASGIPAREVVGFAYTTNAKLRPLSLVRDVLHAWPQYYDAQKRVWISVDPTWANTTGGINYFDKLDFNHIIFAIHGVSSEYPYPAGAYKESGKTGKDVDVTFAEIQPIPPAPNLHVSYDMPPILLAGFTSKGSVKIQNATGVSIESVDISVQSTPVDVAINTIEKNIPPFAIIDIPISLNMSNYLMRGKGRITTTVNGAVTNLVIDIRPSYWLLLPVGIITAGLLSLLWIGLGKKPLWKR